MITNIIKREIVRNRYGVTLYTLVLSIIFTCLIILFTFSSNIANEIKIIIGDNIDRNVVWVNDMKIDDIKKVDNKLYTYTVIDGGIFWLSEDKNKALDFAIIYFNGVVPKFVTNYEGGDWDKNERIGRNYPIKISKELALKYDFELGEVVEFKTNQTYYGFYGVINCIYEKENDEPDFLIPIDILNELSRSVRITSFEITSSEDLLVVDNAIRGYEYYSGGFAFDAMHVALSVDTILTVIKWAFLIASVILITFIMNSFICKRIDFISTLRAIGYYEFNIYFFYYLIVLLMSLAATLLGTIFSFISIVYINKYIKIMFNVKNTSIMFNWYDPLIILGAVVVFSFICMWIMSIFSNHSSIVKKMKGGVRE